MKRLLALAAGAATAQGHDAPLSKKETAVFLFSVAAVMALAFYLRLEFLLMIVVVGGIGGVLVMQSAVAWIAISILGFIGVFWNLEAGLTLPEVLHTVVFYGGLIWWFFHRIVIARAPLRWTLGGILTLTVFLQLALMAPISLGYGADPYVWLREMVIVSTPLILVPIAHECDSRPKQNVVLGALVLAMSVLSVKNIYLYKQKVLEAVWLWQVGASRATETTYFVLALALFATALLVAARGKRQILFFSAVFTLGIAATVLSFYRTIWVGALAGYFFMAVIMGRSFWKRAVKYAGISLLVLAAAYPLLLADVVPLDVMWSSISGRFESIGEYRTDVSVKNRDAEARAVLDDIGLNWVIGKGMSTTVHFTKLTSLQTIAPTWTHNGYAWVLNHLGVLGTLLYFSSLLAYVALGWRNERALRGITGPGEEDRYRVRILSATAAAFILSTFLISITLNAFVGHESGIVLGVLFGLLEVWGGTEGTVGATPGVGK
jgi:hypothetical protein